MNTTAWHGALIAAVLSATAPLCAAQSSLSALVGGWGYDIKGEITNGGTLDFERDLALRATGRFSAALAYRPAGAGWLPALALDYQRVAAEGMQTIPGVADGSAAEPLFDGLGVGAGTRVRDSADLRDVQLNARWGYDLSTLRLSGGLTLVWLDGPVVVADADSGESRTQDISQLFPLLSIAAEWQPLPSVSLTLRGDYAEYEENKAQGLEGTVLWKLLGPVGLEAGYRQRRYRVKDGGNDIDARLLGARVGMRMEWPL